MAPKYLIQHHPDSEPLKGPHTTLYLFVTFGATGAVSAQSGVGLSIARIGAGRYAIQLSRTYKRLLKGHVTLVAGDTAALTAAAGNAVAWRDDDIATDGTINVQFWSTSGTSAADADPTSGHKAVFEIKVSDTDF